jgi:SAM-dependent methyltransferase
MADDERVPGLERFEAAYQGTPPWDIGRPQPVFVRVEAAGLVASPVLDVGCGSGENALFLAERGHRVLGVDIVPLAIEKARQKARERAVELELLVADALALERLGRTFASVVDSAVFHVFDDEQRALYVESLGRVLAPGGRYFMLVFSDHEPPDWGGPRRIRRSEIEAAFRDGWQIVSIEEERMDTNFHEQGGRAWFAIIERR